MTDSNNNNNREQDKVDAREFAAMLKDSRRDLLFNNYVSVAVSGYMHGVLDTFKSFQAAQLPA